MTRSNSESGNIILQQGAGPGCLVQSLWFIFVGWWLGAIVITLAWFLNITIIGLPLGLALLNNIPMILALQDPKRYVQVVIDGDRTLVRETGQPQMNFFLRAIYFVLIGWWWSGIWLVVGYLLCATIILLPVGLGMFRLTPLMTTLRRY